MRGSSPLARGLPRTISLGIILRRIIPARAGFTRLDIFKVKCTLGSSPLARGLRLYAPHTRDRAGIIPARAGFTSQDERVSMTNADHPRSRGVYGGENDDPRCGWRGIIPARAGFTAAPTGSMYSRKDHPRSRGVYVAG